MEKPVIGTEIGQYLFGVYHNGDDVRVKLFVQIPPNGADENKEGVWLDEHTELLYKLTLKDIGGPAVFRRVNQDGEDYYTPLLSDFERDDVKAAIIALATSAQVSYSQKSLAEALTACYSHYADYVYMLSQSRQSTPEKQDDDVCLPIDYPRLVDVYGIGKELVLVDASGKTIPEKTSQRFVGVITSAQIFTSVKQNGTLMMLDAPYVRFTASKKVGHEPSFVALVRLNTTAHPGADQVCWEDANVEEDYWADARQYLWLMGNKNPVLKNIRTENPGVDWSVWQ